MEQNKNIGQKNKVTLTHKTGDKIERLGEKLQRSGAEKLGKVVYNTGNKFEHLQDKGKKH